MPKTQRILLIALLRLIGPTGGVVALWVRDALVLDPPFPDALESSAPVH